MYNNILITGANSAYFESLLTLISTVHKYSFDVVDQIIVYNFGLDLSEVSRLETLSKVMVVDVDKNNTVYQSISSVKIKCYFLKLFALTNATSYGKNILWIDSGACVLRNIKEIFDEIESKDIFLVGDIHLNKNYTHKRCVEIMNATKDELNDRQLWAGLVGYKHNGIYSNYINESWGFAQVDGCIDGFDGDHRHDQSILSILASRYNCPRQDIDIYGYWTDVNRKLENALQINSVIFAHRRGYDNKNYLIYEN